MKTMITRRIFLMSSVLILASFLVAIPIVSADPPPQDEVTVIITIFADEGSLTIHVSGNEPPLIKDLNLEYRTSTGIYLKRFLTGEGFAPYVDGKMSPPFCLRLETPEVDSPPPPECPPNKTPVVRVPEGSAFWWNELQRNTRSLLVFFGQDNVGICNACFRSCLPILIPNCPRPIPDPESQFTATITSTTPTNTETSTGPETPGSTPVRPLTAEAEVVAGALYLRPGPGLNYDPPMCALYHGEILDIIGRIDSNRWIQVVPATSPEMLGWVSNWPEYVQIYPDVDLNEIPIATVQSQPVEDASSVTLTPPPAAEALSESPILPQSSTYPAPVLTAPDDGNEVQGEYPPLYWTWDGELGEDEFFEVRIWHEKQDFQSAMGWVKAPQFDYNVKGHAEGKYYWTVIVVKGANAKPKDWTLKPWWPYPIWEGELVTELSNAGEPRFFKFTPDPNDPQNPGPPSCDPSDPKC